MSEDREFGAFVKAALEEGFVLGDGKARALERLAERAVRDRRRGVRSFGARWGAVPLLAAGLALAVVFRVLVSPPPVSESSAVVDAIELLCELEGLANPAVGAKSDGEQLLAWQEAPCADLL